MFTRLIFPAYFSEVFVRFNRSNPKRLPKSVKDKVDSGWLDSYLAHNFLAAYMSGKGIVPMELLQFGTITMTAKRDKSVTFDERLEERNQYYCWKMYCKQGEVSLNLVLVLGEITEAMKEFNEKKPKEQLETVICNLS